MGKNLNKAADQASLDKEACRRTLREVDMDNLHDQEEREGVTKIPPRPRKQVLKDKGDATTGSFPAESD